jgi:uncharacterized protein (DUF934 family)
MLDTYTPQNRSLIVNQAVAKDYAILGKNLFILNNNLTDNKTDNKNDNSLTDINENTVSNIPTDLETFGVLVNGDCDIQLIKPYLSRLNLIAIQFPKVVDGRGYSLAYLLRNRLKFTGELRAVGDFTRDQLFFLQRTGFNAMTLRAGENAEAALSAFNTFSIRYQGSSDTSNPLFIQESRHA